MDAEPRPPPLSILLDSARPAADRVQGLLPEVYEQLRAAARNALRGERKDHTLQATALVHEAYLRIAGSREIPWENRAHFYAAAAQAMRRILVDHARSRRAVRHGGALQRVPLESVAPAAEERADLLVALDEALDRLRRLDERQARVVECRFFGGMTEEETAEALGIGVRTARRDWVKAKSWLHGDLYPD